MSDNTYSVDQISNTLFKSFNEQARAVCDKKCHGYGEVERYFAYVKFDRDRDSKASLCDSNGKVIVVARDDVALYLPASFAMVHMAAPGAIYSAKREMLGTKEEVKAFQKRLQTWLRASLINLED